MADTPSELQADELYKLVVAVRASVRVLESRYAQITQMAEGVSSAVRKQTEQLQELAQKAEDMKASNERLRVTHKQLNDRINKLARRLNLLEAIDAGETMLERAVTAPAAVSKEE